MTTKQTFLTDRIKPGSLSTEEKVLFDDILKDVTTIDSLWEVCKVLYNHDEDDNVDHEKILATIDSLTNEVSLLLLFWTRVGLTEKEILSTKSFFETLDNSREKYMFLATIESLAEKVKLLIAASDIDFDKARNKKS